MAQASRGMTQALAAIGVGVSARELVQFAVASDRLATSYARQSVAARNLAGSQSELNELLSVYDQATGGALDKASALQNVTKLMAVGFADSAQELDQFATAIRGISIAMGTTQEFATQNLILELFSQRGYRLDQLGLEYDIVRQRAEELQAADANLTKQMAYQQAVLEQAIERFGGLADSAEGAATGLEQLSKEWGNLMLSLGSTGAIDFVAQAMAEWLKDARRDIGYVIQAIQELEKAWDRLRFAAGVTDINPDLNSGISDRTRGNAPRATAAAADPLLAERNEAIVEWHKETLAIERQAARDRIDATNQFEQQRTDAIRQYEQTIAREAQDFALQRARSEQDYALGLQRMHRDIASREARQFEDLERTIADARMDAAERATERQVALDERIAETRAESNERIAEMEEDFQRSRQRAQRDHAERLRDAAANLDAVAVREAQRDFRNSQSDAQEDFDERLDKERKNEAKRLEELNKAHAKQTADEGRALQKRIDDANAAYQQQLDDARAADEQRLEDMSADRALRLERENEDRALRLERLREDHEAQLGEMAAQHELRLIQISEQETEELQAHNEAFDEQMASLNTYHDGYLESQTAFQNQALLSYQQYLDAQAAELARRMPGPVQLAQPWSGPVFDGGVPPAASSVTNHARTSTVTIAPGAINVIAPPNMALDERAASWFMGILADFFEGYPQ